MGFNSGFKGLMQNNEFAKASRNL